MKTLALTASLLAAGPALADRPAPLRDADFRSHSQAEVTLGRLLFWDAELSGNRNISCGTCHHPRFGTGDGVSLSLGEGGRGLGPDRVADPANPPEQRIPRNAPHLFNLGVLDLRTLFHDGRIEADKGRASGLRTPLEDRDVAGFASLLAAQSMFPVLTPDEMAGHSDENEISDAVRKGLVTGPDGALDRVAARVRGIPEYRRRFAAAYPDIAAGRPIAYPDIANAMAAFVSTEWRSDAAPFDAWLKGAPLPPQAQAGADLFYGAAGCSACHAGPLLTDQQFHATATPQLGPGKSERFELSQRDPGRMRVTNRAQDAFAFRTPSLRNVTATAPYGHAGAHRSLRAFVTYHAAPDLAAYARDAVLPAFDPARPDWTILDDEDEVAAMQAAAAPMAPLTPAEAEAILAFLDTLTDPAALRGRLGIPASVPSGLPVAR